MRVPLLTKLCLWYCSSMKSTTVTDLIQNFAEACRCLVPALERAEVPWQDKDQWDNWDRIAEPLFESLVSEPCAFHAVGESTSSTLRVPRYGFELDTLNYNAWIALSGNADKRMIGLSTLVSPFDQVEFVENGKRSSMLLGKINFTLFFEAPDLSQREITVVNLSE